jgi:hypothetical protein
MPDEKLFADVIQEIYKSKKSGALYVSMTEASEDLFKMYFSNGDIYHVQFGSAMGNDCLDIIEYYELNSATYFDGVSAPERLPSIHLPPTKIIIALIRKHDKKVKFQ